MRATGATDAATMRVAASRQNGRTGPPSPLVRWRALVNEVNERGRRGSFTAAHQPRQRKYWQNKPLRDARFLKL